MPPKSFSSKRHLPLLLFFAALLTQLPLILNPGYYSHDELQWAAFAQQGVHVGWLDPSVFQFRPLTFNLWMLLSRALFDAPMLFHGVLVAWGSVNAALLFIVGRRFGMPASPAALGALVFALSPYATYTHGWVGCIADLIWLSCALLIVAGVQRMQRVGPAAALGAALTLLALLGKEAAFAIPPLLAVAWWFDARKPKWLAAMLGAGAMAALYLALRADVLLNAPREGTQYTLSLFNIPLRWLEYQLFPPIIPLVETFTTLQRSAPAWIAGVLWLGLFGALWQASRRLAALFVLGGIAALLPVLPLASSFNHYAYGFAAVSCMVVAAAWPLASRMGRAAIIAFAALSVLHGGFVMLRMQEVGRIQSVFSPALAQAVRTHPGQEPLRLQLAPDAKEWVFRRLTHAIPEYDGVLIGDRVTIVASAAAADYRIDANGGLQPLR